MGDETLDISRILNGWDYAPDEVTVRIIVGDDHKEKVQMRLDLGLLQMELQGRPDGRRPHGYESLFEYYQDQLKKHVQKYGSHDGFFLDPDDCDAIVDEATQYYYRYLSLFHLQRYQDVKRDTERNLRVFDFLNEYAEDEEDQYMLEQYRPYLLMMHARSSAHIEMENGDIEAALKIVDEGIRKIEEFFQDFERNDLSNKCGEILFLREFREAIFDCWKNDPVFELREKMKKAVEREDYETAAQLRDEIKRLQG